MSFILDNLSEDEVLEYSGNVHWFVFYQSIINVAISLVCAVLWISLNSPLLMLVSIVALVISLYHGVKAFIHMKSTEVGITNQRVLLKTGLILRHTHEIPLSKIESVSLNQSILGRLLDFADIDVKGVGTGIDSIKLISKPLEFRKALNTKINT